MLKSYKKILISFVVTGLFCTNTYAFVLNQEMKNEIKVLSMENEIMEKGLLDSKISASQEDIILAFNSYSIKNKIEYENQSYYFDIKEVKEYKFNKNEKYHFSANVFLSILKDEKIKGQSAIQEIIPMKALNDFQNLTAEKNKEVDDFNFSLNQPLYKEKLISLEKEQKEKFVVLEKELEISFFVENKINLELNEMSQELLFKTFLDEVVFKRKTTNLGMENNVNEIHFTARVDSEEKKITYNKETNELYEIK